MKHVVRKFFFSLLAVKVLHKHYASSPSISPLFPHSGLDLPFMMMPHPLLPMGLPPASVAMAMSQMNHLNTIANMAAAAQQIHTHVHRAPVIKVKYTFFKDHHGG